MELLNLSETERQLLIELLEREIPSLREEIRHTDDHDYREALKEREPRMKALVEKLKGSQ